MLVSLFDFENKEGIFPAVHRSFKFCLLTVSGIDEPKLSGAEFVFFARDVTDIVDANRRFRLTASDVSLINPNTKTCPTFRSQYDAELSKWIYQQSPILIRDEGTVANPWNIEFYTMFHMTNDSGLFVTPDYVPENSSEYLPLYEAKMVDQYDHRFAGVIHYSERARTGEPQETNLEQHKKADFYPEFRYWVLRANVDENSNPREYNIGYMVYKDITTSSSERTLKATFIPYSGVGNSAPIIRSDFDRTQTSALLANFNSFVVDFIARQKVGYLHINFFVIKQFPIIPPHTYLPTLLNFIVPRVLELSYTAWDLLPFAQDVGWDGPPFMWDEERRFLMRCELDALYFHLYQIQRDDVDYIMETFPIVKRKDEAAHGEYLTKRIILEMYDQMAALPATHVPAPKDESATYAVPDVSQWVTWLEPGPADERVAHSSQ